MSYAEELLGRGEQILYVARQHILMLISRILTGLALIGVLVAAGVVSRTAFSHTLNIPILGIPISLNGELILTLMFFISILILFSIFTTFLRWNSDKYVLTDRRIIHISGVFSKRVIDSSLSKINDVMLNQSILGRMFNFGSIEIMTSSEDSSNIMEGVAEPLEFKRVMLEAKYNYDHGYGYLEAGRSNSMHGDVPQPVPAQFDVHRTLEELARLRDRGILSRDEFEAKKRELLNRI